MKKLIDTIKFNKILDVDYTLIRGMLSSYHETDCCEWSELDFDSFKQDFQLAKDMLSQIDKMDIYAEDNLGITFFFYDGDTRHGIFTPGRGSNNGYYSDDLKLIIATPDDGKFEYDITKYQTIVDPFDD